MKNVGRLTLEWLARHHVEYDEIYFGKPNGDVYIDDRGLRFATWACISEALLEQVARAR